MVATTETLRSTFTADGQRLSLEYIEATKQYAIATPWQWLFKCGTFAEAVTAFEVLEFCEGDLKAQVSVLKKEMLRTKTGAIVGSAMARTNHILTCMERRAKGLRPVLTGSKGSVIKWVSV